MPPGRGTHSASRASPRVGGGPRSGRRPFPSPARLPFGSLQSNCTAFSALLAVLSERAPRFACLNSITLWGLRLRWVARPFGWALRCSVGNYELAAWAPYTELVRDV